MILMTLENLVKEALSLSRMDNGTPIVSVPLLSHEAEKNTRGGNPDILVIGIGTAGTRIVQRLNQLAGPELRTLTIISNRRSLKGRSTSSHFTLKSSYFSGGFGLCGGDPDLAERYSEATKKARPDIEALVGNPGFCFIVAGMGGNMGTGAAPVIAHMMRERGAVVTVIVTRPFHLERQRIIRAEQGIRKLSDVAHTLLILDFERLKSVLPAVKVLLQQFSVMNHIIALTIHNIWESTYCESFENFDPKDLHFLLERGTTGTLLVGEFDRNDKEDRRSLNEIQVPLMDFPAHKVKGCILHITAGNDIDLFDTGQIAEGLSMPFDFHVDVIWGTTIRKEMEGKVRVFTIVTRFHDEIREAK